MPLFDGYGNSFCVNSARDGNRLPILLALLNVEANSFEHAEFSGIDGIAKTIDAGQILAVGVVLTVFFFDGYRIGVVGHANQAYLAIWGESSIAKNQLFGEELCGRRGLGRRRRLRWRGRWR